MLHFDYQEFVQTNSYTTDVGDAYNRSAGINSSSGDGHCGYNHLVFRQEAFIGSQHPFAPELQPSEGLCTDATFWEPPSLEQRPELSHLHAPVPLPGCAPILRTLSYQPEEVKVADSDYLPFLHPLQMSPQYRPSNQVYVCSPLQQSEHNRLPSPPSGPALQSTFLTPSELLVELSNQENRHPSRVSHGRADTLERPPRFGGSSTAKATAPIPKPPFLPPFLNDDNTESISSHEKKRHYLECLEHYVAFLHDHCRRCGLEPAPLERISNYRCLNSKSIRSLLIHMEKVTKQMKDKILREEQKFLRLRDALHLQESNLEMPVVQGV